MENQTVGIPLIRIGTPTNATAQTEISNRPTSPSNRLIIFTLLKVAMTHEFNPDPTIGLNYLSSDIQNIGILLQADATVLPPKGTNRKVLISGSFPMTVKRQART